MALDWGDQHGQPKNFQINDVFLPKSEVKFDMEFFIDLFKFEVDFVTEHNFIKIGEHFFLIFEKIGTLLKMIEQLWKSHLCHP